MNKEFEESKKVAKCLPTKPCPVAGVCRHKAKPYVRNLYAVQVGPNPVYYAWREPALCTVFQPRLDTSNHLTKQ